MFTLEKNKAVAIVASSNGLYPSRVEEVQQLCAFFAELGFPVKISQCIYGTKDQFAAPALQRAQAINEFYADEEVQAVFDISGGDAANNILEYLNYPLLEKNSKPYFGYSDLTTVLNALRKKAKVPVCLFSAMTLVGEGAKVQKEYFTNNFIHSNPKEENIKAEFLRGESLEGIVEGGNVRCLLKLAGTSYWPDLNGKILLLESYGGDAARLTTYLYQLRQMQVFTQVKGLLLGQFTQWEREGASPTIEEMALSVTEQYGISIAKTDEIGHSSDAKALWLGSSICL